MPVLAVDECFLEYVSESDPFFSRSVPISYVHRIELGLNNNSFTCLNLIASKVKKSVFLSWVSFTNLLFNTVLLGFTARGPDSTSIAWLSLSIL